MRAPAKLAVFGLTMGVVLVAALGVGAAVGPASSPDRPSDSARGQDAMGEGGTDMDGMVPGDMPRGLAASADGYALAPAIAMLPAGETTSFAFRVLGPDGNPLTRYTPEHERELHFIIVRPDLTGYQHLHPTRATDGTWSVPLRLNEAGTYKSFADFQPAGAPMPMTLGSASPSPATSVPSRSAGHRLRPPSTATPSPCGVCWRAGGRRMSH